MKMLMCKFCGKAFVSKQHKQTYCSKDCYYAALLQRSADKRASQKHGANGVNIKLKPMSCVICGTKYETAHGRVTCSSACHIIRRNETSKVNTASRKMPDHKYQNTRLVDSICPLCRRVHKAPTSRNYCRVCKIAVSHGNLADAYEGGRVFSYSRSHGACA